MASEQVLRGSLKLALGRLRPAITAAAVLIALYLLIPIVIILPVSLTDNAILTWPPRLLSLRWFGAFFDSPEWREALFRSFRISVLVAVVATTLGTLAALGLGYAQRWRRVLRTLFIAPLVLPVLSYALGLYEVSERFSLTGSIWPVVIGQTMLAAPLAFVVLSAGIASGNPELPRAAASLGAPARTILWRIELPLLRPSILAAALITLAYSFDEIVIAYFLLPIGNRTLPVQILSSTREAADPTVAAASMIVIGVAATTGAIIVLVRAVVASRRSA